VARLHRRFALRQIGKGSVQRIHQRTMLQQGADFGVGDQRKTLGHVQFNFLSHINLRTSAGRSGRCRLHAQNPVSRQFMAWPMRWANQRFSLQHQLNSCNPVWCATRHIR
jgi:hypothetical protein